MALTREIEELVGDLRNQGWRVIENNSGPGHYTAFPPDSTKRPFSFAGSGDRRAYFNTVCKLRQLGFRERQEA